MEKKSKVLTSTRQRKAAYKAWDTIRKNVRKKNDKNSEKIEKYISVQKISSIRHPETIPQKTTSKYGNGIVSVFEKTPADIACGRFWELRWAYGCPLDCNYCYLRGTMKGKMKPNPLKSKHVLAAIDDAFSKIQTPAIFNTGELSDSLMFPTLMEKIINRFDEQTKHKVILLSKMGRKNTKFLLKKLRKQTICSWSINATQVAKRWENAAALPEERIDCAKAVKEIGYDTRIRLDPIFPIYEWKKHYGQIIEYLMDKLVPDRIIMGTPRGLWKTIKYANETGMDMTWSNFFNEDSSWGKKLAYEQRQSIYEFVIDKLVSTGYSKSKITMCKETVNMWETLGMKYVPLTCNCYAHG